MGSSKNAKPREDRRVKRRESGHHTEHSISCRLPEQVVSRARHCSTDAVGPRSRAHVHRARRRQGECHVVFWGPHPHAARLRSQDFERALRSLI